VKVHWATEYAGEGNVYGYATMNARAREALAPHVEYAADAPVVIHCFPAHRFVPVPGKVNVLYSCWEVEAMAPEYAERMNRADIHVTPAEFSARTFRRYCPHKPVYVVPLGVDLDVYKYRLPIKQLFGSRIPDILGDDPVMAAVLSKADDRIHKAVEKELNYELSKL
jgi:glycosyltransferase involved in cell wall biosynthesis